MYNLERFHCVLDTGDRVTAVLLLCLKAAQAVLITLYNLNPDEFMLMLSVLPKTFQVPGCLQSLPLYGHLLLELLKYIYILGNKFL